MSLWDSLFGKPKKRKRKPKKTPKRAFIKLSKHEAVYKERAKWLNRDLREGTISPSEVDAYIKADWDKDSDEYEDAYGIKSYKAFHAGVKRHIK
jgi:hypothetical protein